MYLKHGGYRYRLHRNNEITSVYMWQVAFGYGRSQKEDFSARPNEEGSYGVVRVHARKKVAQGSFSRDHGGSLYQLLKDRRVVTRKTWH